MKKTGGFLLFTLLFILPLLFVSPAWGKELNLLSPLPQTPERNNVLNKSQSGGKISPTNILLLGLDARKGDGKPRCDSIHIFSLEPDKKKIRIISIPRGTPVSLPEVEKTSAYLANACHVKDIDYTVTQIEKIAGVKVDYLVKIGFSQALGIFRYLGLPTTSTLQFLRDRKLPFGDNQRSRNQAIFIKDQIVNHLEEVARLPQPVKYLLYRTLTTNLDFETADLLVNFIVEQKIYKDQKVELVTKPSPLFALRETHYREENTGVKSAETQEYENYQNNLRNYLAALLKNAYKLVGNQPYKAYLMIITPFSQKLWLQIDDDDTRNNLHFEFLRLFVLTSPDKENLLPYLKDFMTEMETEGNEKLQEKGEELRSVIPI